MKDKYHHGNLKQELIEKGLEYIDKHGEESLSMRKLADSAGVSSAAPYAHFKNKEEYLDIVSKYITEKFCDALQSTIDSCKDPTRILLELGKGYVFFFYENPLYYKFLFTRGNIEVKEYRPFQLFEQTVEDFFKNTVKREMPEEILHAKMYALWSMVHGLAQLVTIPGVINLNDIDGEVERILSSVTV